MSVLDTVKKRTVIKEEEKDLLSNDYDNYVHEDEEDYDDLPYKGKVYLARKKRDDSWLCIGIQVI